MKGFTEQGRQVSVSVTQDQRLRIPKKANGRRKVETRLRRELEVLKQMLDTGHGLRVRWLPDGSPTLEGEVKGYTVYIYSQDPVKARETLVHEFLDYTVSQTIEPYRKVTNAFIALMNDECYRRKEKLVERLAKLLDSSQSHS